MSAVFKTVCEGARASLGGFDSHTPPPCRFWILDFGFWKDDRHGGEMVTEIEFKNRTKDIALRIIKLVASLPKTWEAEIIGKQLLRSGTSVGANYRAACRGKSIPDVINKLAIVEEEADESMFWIELLTEAEIIPERKTSVLHNDIDEIIAMTVASIKTMRMKKSKIQNPESKMR
jgi:four helix bundle protein